MADYPFTTLVPNLGVCEMDYRTTVFADIPGEILLSQGEASYCVRQIAIGVQAMSYSQQVTAECQALLASSEHFLLGAGRISGRMQQRVCRHSWTSTLRSIAELKLLAKTGYWPPRYRVSRAQDVYLVFYGPVHQLFWSLHRKFIQAGRCPVPEWLHWECDCQGNNIYHTFNARPAAVNRQQECGPGQQGVVQF